MILAAGSNFINLEHMASWYRVREDAYGIALTACTLGGSRELLWHVHVGPCSRMARTLPPVWAWAAPTPTHVKGRHQFAE